MDFVTWLTYSATAIGAAFTTLGGAYFWVRRGNQKLASEARNDSYNAEKRQDDDAIKRWQDFAEYQQQTFRQKNEEQDARLCAMQKEHDDRLSALFKHLDEMHHAHLKCERDGMEREMALKQEAMNRDIEIKRNERMIEDLKKDLESVKATLAMKVKE